MATFLEICQQVHRWVRAGNNTPGTVPTTVVGQTLELGDIVYFVGQAWLQLQQYHPDWRWMVSQGGLTLFSGVRVYSLATIQINFPRLAVIRPLIAASNIKYSLIFDISAPTRTDMPVWFISYEEWRGWWDRQPRTMLQKPCRFTIRPDRAVEVDPTPNDAPSGDNWQLVFDYKKTPQVLAIDGDIPELPEEYHDLIVWWAVNLFCRNRSNSDQLRAESGERINWWLERLAQDQLPEMTFWPRYSA